MYESPINKICTIWKCLPVQSRDANPHSEKNSFFFLLKQPYYLINLLSLRLVGGVEARNYEELILTVD